MTSTPPVPTLAVIRDLLARLDPKRIEPCGVPGCIHMGSSTGNGHAMAA